MTEHQPTRSELEQRLARLRMRRPDPRLQQRVLSAARRQLQGDRQKTATTRFWWSESALLTAIVLVLLLSSAQSSSIERSQHRPLSANFGFAPAPIADFSHLNSDQRRPLGRDPRSVSKGHHDYGFCNRSDLEDFE